MRALSLEHLHSNPIGVYGDVLREQGIDLDRVRLDEGEPVPDWREYDLLVVMGGGMSAYQEAEYPWLVDEKRLIAEAVDAGTPYFGVCLGSQLLAASLGARVYRGPEPELGVDPMFLCEPARRDPVFRGFPIDVEVFQWHCDTFELPAGATRLARSPRYENEAFRFGPVAYAIQCHLETTVDDVRDWFAAWPGLVDTFEERHGAGAVTAFLQEYADSVPHLRRTAAQLFRRWLENALVQRGRGGGAFAWEAGESPPTALIGREREQRQISRLLARVRVGQGGALLVRGEAGLGKTALLDGAAEQAADVQVLRFAGRDDELELPHAGLRALCEPLLDRLDELPEPQRSQLAAALGRGAPAARGDRFATYVAAHALLALAARERPLLVCVDDAHLLDDATLEAVSVLVGRVDGEPIGLLVASGGVSSALGDVETLDLAPLDPVQARMVLARRFGDELSPRVVAEVIDVARGNPLALLEIPACLSPEQRAGDVALGDTLQLLATAEQAFLERSASLRPSARLALLVAALADEDRVSVLEPAVEALGSDRAALEECKRARLVELSDDRLSFRHGLVRSTAIYGALRTERRAAHAALAETLAAEPERIAWHRALAAPGQDEGVAAALEQVARAASDRRAPASAARMLELAARLSPDPSRRSRRLVDAAGAAALAGHVYAAIDHLELALSDLDDPFERARAEHLLGVVLARSGSAGRAEAVLVEGADRCEHHDARLAGAMLADAVIPALRAGRPEQARASGERALALSGSDSDEGELRAALMLGTALAFTGDLERARGLVARSAALSIESTDPRLRGYLGMAQRLVGEHDAARDVLSALVDEARFEGSIGVLAYALVRLADVDLDEGRLQEARAALEDGAALALETGQAADHGLACGGLAWLAAIEGREDECRRRAAIALDIAERLGAGSRLDRAEHALGLLAFARGDHEEAVEHLARVRGAQLEQGWCDAATQPHCGPDLVEALALSSRRDEARSALDIVNAEIARSGRASALAAAFRCEGLLAPPEELRAHFEQALEIDERTTGPFERARTELHYGRRLRELDAAEAEPQLRSALDRFAALGAETWAEAAQRELELISSR